MDRARSWGIDVMRVPFTWAALEPVQGQDDENWLSLYDQLLDAAWARGIWTIIDFHQDVYSEVYCGDGFPGWTVANPPAPAHDCPGWGLEYVQDPSVIAAFDAFWAPGSPVMTAYQAAWDVMIARYKDKPGVLGFELINEPGWGSQDESTFTATTLTAFYSVMVPRVRAEAPTSLVFLDATGLDGTLLATGLQKPTGDGMVFAPHFYPFTHSSGAVVSLMQNWANMGIAWDVPVFIGEFGVGGSADGAADYMAANFAALDTLGVVGGTEWEYSTSVDLWNSEGNSVAAPDGTEYPIATALIRPFARAVAGGNIMQSFDAATTQLALTYTPSATQSVTFHRPPSPSLSERDHGRAHGRLLRRDDGARADARSGGPRRDRGRAHHLTELRLRPDPRRCLTRTRRGAFAEHRQGRHLPRRFRRPRADLHVAPKAHGLRAPRRPRVR